MTLFLLACACLIALSGLFYLFPRTRAGGDEEDLERANLEWFRLRQEELQTEGDSSLAADARLRLLEDEHRAPQAETGSASGGKFPAWILLPLVAVFSGLLYHQIGSVPDVLISRQLQALDDNATPLQMDALMQAIAERAEQRPGNLHYTAMLGRYYMGQQNYARAAGIYGELSIAAPQDAQALAYAAQAQYLAAGRALDDTARMRAEQALAIDPHQRTALGLLGMASYEQGLYRAAIEYWERLIAMEPPGSETSRMIGGVIASAREKLGETPQDVAPATADTSPAVASAGVTVEVMLPEGAAVNPADTVFVLARNAESQSRMPIAVQRLQGAQLPLRLRLDDSNSMAGQKLSQAESIVVVVQVSPDGRPGEANATWVGQAGPLTASIDGEAVVITLQPASG